jgi:hypothetical protein
MVMCRCARLGVGEDIGSMMVMGRKKGVRSTLLEAVSSFSCVRPSIWNH